MRHFLLLPLSVRGLARGVGVPAVQRALVTPSCLSHRLPPRSLPARLTAVALASVTPATQEELPQALGPATHHESQCFHAPPGAWLASGVTAPSALPPSHRPPTSHSPGAPPGRPSRCSWRAFRFSTARARAPSPPHSLPTTFQSPPDPLQQLPSHPRWCSHRRLCRAEATTTVEIWNSGRRMIGNTRSLMTINIGWRARERCPPSTRRRSSTCHPPLQAPGGPTRQGRQRQRLEGPRLPSHHAARQHPHRSQLPKCMRLLLRTCRRLCTRQTRSEQCCSRARTWRATGCASPP